MMEQFMAALGGAQALQRGPGLNAVLDTGSLDKLAEDDAACSSLHEHLPEGERNAQGVRDTFHSPQMRQAIKGLNEALRSDQIQIVLASLGIDASVLNESNDGVEALVKGLIRKYSKKE